MTNAGPTPAPIIQVEGLTKDYRLDGKRIEVLKGVQLTLSAGEKVSIMGRSGVGKSTLLHVLGTLDRPTKGIVRFEGEEVFGFSESKLARFRNRTIGFVFQFHYLLPDFTALENLMIPMRMAKTPLSAMQEHAWDLLDRVGLKERAHHKPGELSGGEQQRVAIARSLVMSPKLLLADEPTGNLDGRTSEDIHDLLSQLNATLGTTLVVVTHNPSLADRMDRKLVLRDGLVEERDAGQKEESRT